MEYNPFFTNTRHPALWTLILLEHTKVPKSPTLKIEYSKSERFKPNYHIICTYTQESDISFSHLFSYINPKLKVVDNV